MNVYSHTHWGVVRTLAIVGVVIGASCLGCRAPDRLASANHWPIGPVCGREAYWAWAADPANIRSARDAALRGDRSAVEALVYHCGVTHDTEGLVRWLSVGSSLGIRGMLESLDAIEDEDGRIRPPAPEPPVTDPTYDPFVP